MEPTPRPVLQFLVRLHGMSPDYTDENLIRSLGLSPDGKKLITRAAPKAGRLCFWPISAVQRPNSCWIRKLRNHSSHPMVGVVVKNSTAQVQFTVSRSPDAKNDLV